MTTSLLAFFRPQGVVIVGASSSSEKLGYGAARNLVQSGYTGAIHFVSQKAGTLFDRPVYKDLKQVPDPVDLAVLIVPPEATSAALEACGRRRIQAAVIVSSGFREAGPEGARLELECLEIARRHQIRILGPNCIGIIDTYLPLDTTFLQPPIPSKGHIGFVSHSGAFCAAIIDWARGQGFGFSQLVSLGNQADVNETDILPLVGEDGNTRVVVLYLESVADGHRFVQKAREVTAEKPVVALKVGRFEAGQRAAASHTGALGGSEQAFEAAFEKAGILRAASAEQMFDWARALEVCPLPGGKRMAVLTDAGGPGVIAADALETNGLSLAQLSQDTRAALEALLPVAASTHNPVDMLASASPTQYARCLEILLADEAVDGVMVILPPPPMFKAEEAALRLAEVITRTRKPVSVALMGSMLVEKAAGVLRDANIAIYPFPERAASALAVLVRRQEYLAAAANEDAQHQGAQATSAGNRQPYSPGAKAGKISTPDELIESYGIKTAPTRLARSAEEAAALANELGFPIVMKIASTHILHKSDVGGVMVGLKNTDEVKAGYSQIIDSAGALSPKAGIQGVWVQPEVPAGQDIIAGMVRDPLFGPLMMFGSGGVEVEGLRDIAFALAPLSEAEARRMLERTWAGKKLKGFRSIPPADQGAVTAALISLSRLAMENEKILEIEINPLRILAQGAIALDVRVKRSEQADATGH